MKTVERHKKTDFGDVWYVNAADGTYRFAVYKYDDDNDTIYLSNVFVKEDSRRQGYGNEILASAEDYANRLGASVICLKVLSGSDVHRWYKRHGYEDLEKDEEERGYMWMKKELKKVNESIWSDIRDKSLGREDRDEDFDLETENKIKEKDFNFFSEDIVFLGFENTLDGFKKSVNHHRFMGYYRMVVDIETGKTWQDTVIPFVEKNWDKRGYSKIVDEKVAEKEDELSKIGFKKEPGKTISKMLDDWWENIDEETKEKISDYFYGKAEEKYYEEHDPDYNEFTGDDFDVEDEWSRADWMTSVKLYVKYNNKTNESVWADIRNKSLGKEVRGEHELTDEEKVYWNRELELEYFKKFINYVVYDDLYEVTLDGIKRSMSHYIMFSGIDHKKNIPIRDFLIPYVVKNWTEGKKFYDYLKRKENEEREYVRKCRYKEVPDKSIDEVVNDWWDDLDEEEQLKICIEDGFDDDPSQYYPKREDHDPIPPQTWWENCSHREQLSSYTYHAYKKNESVWNDIRKKSLGQENRKEDQLTDDEYNFLDDCKFEFSSRVVWDNEKFSLEKFKECIKRQSKGYENINVENVIKYVDDKWDELRIEIDKLIDVEEKEKEDGMNESCDGVPGGITPANVGGMGEISFPGPNGEPGSGDLPMPTGKVYQQVAPFGIFIQAKKGKKRKKKFRKEDEPCSHSPNAKVYDYVDDYREYVDRTYNNMDRK